MKEYSVLLLTHKFRNKINAFLYNSNNSTELLSKGNNINIRRYYIFGISAEKSGASEAVNVGDLPSLAIRNA